MDSLKLFKIKKKNIYILDMNRTIILQAMIIGKRLQISDWKSKHNPHEVLSDLRFTDQLQNRRATLCWLNSPVYTQVILNSSAVLRHT